MNGFLHAISSAVASSYALAAYGVSALVFLFGGNRIRVLKRARGLAPEAQIAAIERKFGPIPPRYTAAEYSRLKLQDAWFALAGGIVLTLLVIAIVSLTQHSGTFTQKVHVQSKLDNRAIPNAVVAIDVGEYRNYAPTDIHGDNIFREIDDEYRQSDAPVAHIHVEIDRYDIADVSLKLTGADPVVVTLNPFSRDVSGLDSIEARPSRIVNLSGSDSDLTAAAECLREYKDCVDESVDKVLQRTSSAPMAIELRTQALAIRGNQAVHRAPPLYPSAEKDYLEAISNHADNNDGHRDRWRYELAGVYAAHSRYQYDHNDVTGGSSLANKAWAIASEISVPRSDLPTRVDYKTFPTFPWGTAVSRGATTTSAEEIDGQAGVRLTCADGQLAAFHLLGATVSDGSTLAWDWRGIETPADGDARTLNKVDEALQVLVVFETKEVIHYLWDANAPAGFQLSRPDGTDASLQLLLFVLRSGNHTFGLPHPEHIVRNIAADYRSFPGTRKDVPRIVAVGLQTRCEATHSRGDAWISPLVFNPRPTSGHGDTKEQGAP